MKNSSENITLDKLQIGETVKISSLSASGDMRRRLRDVGFCDGTEVSCIMRSPLGDPTAYLVRGVLIALRREDSGRINALR